MTFLWIALVVLLVAFVAVLILRAVAFRPQAVDPAGGEPIAVDADAAATHLAHLIRIRTVSSRDASEVSVDELESFIAALPVLYPSAHKTLTLERVRGYSLLYRWKGKESGDPAVLMAHYDVVSATPDGWKHPPFDGIVAEGAIWGRGSIDTKSTLVCIFEAVERLTKEGYSPRHDIYLSFGHNEEVAGDGAPGIVETFRGRGLSPAFVLDEGGAVVEGIFPGVVKPVALVGVAEKGVTDIEISATGPGGHASTPPSRGVAGALARAIIRLEHKPFKAHFSAPTLEMLDILGRHTPFGLRVVFANLWLFAPLLLRIFTKRGGETNALSRTTLAITMLEGSKGANVLPARVRAVANVRIAVDETVDATVDRIRMAIDDPLIELRVIYRGEPSPVSQTRCAAYDLLTRTIRETFPTAIVSPYVMLGGSDSRHFAAISRYVYRFDPFELSKAERDSMHAANEALPVAKLGKGIAFYLRLIRGL